MMQYLLIPERKRNLIKEKKGNNLRVFAYCLQLKS